MSLRFEIPGSANLLISHLILDYNGTLAEDGAPVPGAKNLLISLQPKLQVHILTADTHNTVQSAFAGTELKIKVIGSGDQAEAKKEYTDLFGPQNCACVGNGRNDQLMLQAAALGIAVIQKEGAYAPLISCADIVCTDILDALNLFLHPLRLAATLRI